MDALDLCCIEGPYSSRDQLLKGSTPQGINSSRDQLLKGSTPQGVNASRGQRLKGSTPQGVNASRGQRLKGSIPQGVNSSRGRVRSPQVRSPQGRSPQVGKGGGVPQLWDKSSVQWVGGKYGGPQDGGVQDRNRMGDPYRGAEGDHVGSRLQAELEG
jgi:hypothetical protein